MTATTKTELEQMRAAVEEADRTLTRLAQQRRSDDVDCTACGEGCLEGTAVVLCGLVYDSECAMAEALRLRSDPAEWKELSDHDKAEALEVIETSARVERLALTRKAG